MIVIQQGLKMAYIRGQNMGTKTNGQRALTFYNITQGPQGGLIYMNDAPASILGQVNVDNEEVVYMQSDMSLANDSFTATISNQDAQLRDVQFVVKVKPLVRQKSTFKVTESKTQLKQMHLDASRLEIFHIVHIFQIDFSLKKPLFCQNSFFSIFFFFGRSKFLEKTLTT